MTFLIGLIIAIILSLILYACFLMWVIDKTESSFIMLMVMIITMYMIGYPISSIQTDQTICEECGCEEVG